MAQVGESPELVAGATMCRDQVQPVTTDRHLRRSRRHQPRRNQSSDEAARASRCFASARAFHARATVSDRHSPEPSCLTTISPPPGSCRRIASTPLPSPVTSGKTPPSAVAADDQCW
ncbi:hypothetical protein F2Q70_00029857 [Brassica cretica]|uniref:Uncharacterized protein n=1 Tax=Brassica cretica TaxID=69181 RepID=A0A8S9FG66_BRACR|nr:hypothetical protein F2Q70_00029857 [Brassica cretica]KAF2553833.1 hypothetical protein F2Q68_00035579 [Brassica cretica]